MKISEIHLRADEFISPLKLTRNNPKLIKYIKNGDWSYLYTDLCSNISYYVKEGILSYSADEIIKINENIKSVGLYNFVNTLTDKLHGENYTINNFKNKSNDKIFIKFGLPSNFMDGVITKNMLGDYDEMDMVSTAKNLIFEIITNSAYNDPIAINNYLGVENIKHISKKDYSFTEYVELIDTILKYFPLLANIFKDCFDVKMREIIDNSDGTLYGAVYDLENSISDSDFFKAYATYSLTNEIHATYNIQMDKKPPIVEICLPDVLYNYEGDELEFTYSDGDIGISGIIDISNNQENIVVKKFDNDKSELYYKYNAKRFETQIESELERRKPDLYVNYDRLDTVRDYLASTWFSVQDYQNFIATISDMIINENKSFDVAYNECLIEYRGIEIVPENIVKLMVDEFVDKTKKTSNTIVVDDDNNNDMETRLGPIIQEINDAYFNEGRDVNEAFRTILRKYKIPYDHDNTDFEYIWAMIYEDFEKFGNFNESDKNFINSLKKFLSKFPDKASSWAQATDEVRDIARMSREIYEEVTGKKLKPVNFKKVGITPSEWNTLGKKFIFDTYAKMNAEAKGYFEKQFTDRFLSDLNEASSIKKMTDIQVTAKAQKAFTDYKSGKNVDTVLASALKNVVDQKYRTALILDFYRKVGGISAKTTGLLLRTEVECNRGATLKVASGKALKAIGSKFLTQKDIESLYPYKDSNSTLPKAQQYLSNLKTTAKADRQQKDKRALTGYNEKMFILKGKNLQLNEKELKKLCSDMKIKEIDYDIEHKEITLISESSLTYLIHTKDIQWYLGNYFVANVGSGIVKDVVVQKDRITLQLYTKYKLIGSV